MVPNKYMQLHNLAVSLIKNNDFPDEIIAALRIIVSYLECRYPTLRK